MKETSEPKEHQVSPLKQFAFLGSDFSSKLRTLSNIAEKENWYYDAPQMTDAQKELGVLFQYVHHTFARLQKEIDILPFLQGGEDVKNLNAIRRRTIMLSWGDIESNAIAFIGV
jgi:hypothetical protein